MLFCRLSGVLQLFEYCKMVVHLFKFVSQLAFCILCVHMCVLVCVCVCVCVRARVCVCRVTC